MLSSPHRTQEVTAQDFEGKVAVVTGAASGIGRGLAGGFAREGMKVVLADVEEPALEAAVRELTQAEHDVIGVKTDVSSAEAIETLAKRAIDAFGKVHVLCNNAGVGGGRGLTWEGTLKDWQWTFGVNFWGVLHGVRTFLPIMVEQGEPGYIVNSASMAGLAPGGGAYGATKHAVVSLSEGLFAQLKLVQAQVGVSVLCPGFVRTQIMDSERNRPDELRNQNEPPMEPIEQMIRDQMNQRIAGGMPPEEVAQIVIEAVRNEQFWITTTDEFDNVIRARMEGILARKNPEISYSF